jgi:KaiC/GvpD/RAD55 family RecA-like ATPase
MIRQEAILRSPLRILDRSIRGGLGKGHLGVIMAPAGVGKSACLVQIGLDALLREKPVLHVAVGQSVEHVAARYDALFDELAERVDLVDRRGVRELVARRRLIWSSMEGPFAARSLDEALAAFQAHLGRWPSTVLVDGFGWEEPGATAAIGAMKASAARAGAELWMTARDAHPTESGQAPRIAPLPDACAALVDVGVFLEPQGRYARLTLVKDFERFPATHVPLVIEGGTLRLPSEDDGPSDDDAGSPEERSPSAFTLLASASGGAEEEFGACAERWGVGEVNFTFAGRRETARTRGLRELSEDELGAGEVSVAYVKAHMHRALAEPELRRVLQAIWHQVSTAGEVFAVGAVNPDKTAHGGTGWAVELARHWGKPVHLFDQELKRWLRWDGGDWAAEEPPAITRERFAGAGTRSLTPDGREAIRALFERSFGAPPLR